jgi:hypothetical protein
MRRWGLGERFSGGMKDDTSVILLVILTEEEEEVEEEEEGDWDCFGGWRIMCTVSLFVGLLYSVALDRRCLSKFNSWR